MRRRRRLRIAAARRAQLQGADIKGMLPDGVAGYVVSVSRKQGFRRLHLLGACQRVPGLSYRDFEEYGLERPPALSVQLHLVGSATLAAGTLGRISRPCLISTGECE